MKLDLSINNESHKSIAESFDRIARELLSNWILQINDNQYIFTEIEFYYFKYGIHPDESTHEHKRKEGEWRAHSQGIDITLGSTEESHGGILIRGIKKVASAESPGPDEASINGPQRVLFEIFRAIGDVHRTDQVFGIIYKKGNTSLPVFKTTRHGLSKSLDAKYSDKRYRYYQDMENWQIKHVSNSTRNIIIDNSEELMDK